MRALTAEICIRNRFKDREFADSEQPAKSKIESSENRNINAALTNYKFSGTAPVNTFLIYPISLVEWAGEPLGDEGFRWEPSKHGSTGVSNRSELVAGTSH